VVRLLVNTKLAMTSDKMYTECTFYHIPCFKAGKAKNAQIRVAY